MNSFSLNVESILLGQSIVCDQTIEVKDGLIVSISDCHQPPEQIVKGLLVPGFIDTQVNGGGGYLFNQDPCLETLQKIAKAHQQHGTTGWLPTFITDSRAKMAAAANAVAQAIRQKTSGVLGIHFEGPFISKEKKGIHAENHIAVFTAEDLAFFKRKDLGQIIVTLAPEAVSIEHIKALVSAGVIVSLGHTNATYAQAQAAFDAGATGVTHLFNAMSPFNSREPGLVGASFVNKRIFCGLILDGIHVHPMSAKVAIQTISNIMLVTDAMPPAASNVTSFEYCGEQYIKQDNKLCDRQGRLAGSNLTMNQAVINSQSMLGLSICQSIKLVSYNPASFLGLEQSYGELKVGKKASMLLLSEDKSIVTSWIDGFKVF